LGKLDDQADSNRIWDAIRRNLNISVRISTLFLIKSIRYALTVDAQSYYHYYYYYLFGLQMGFYTVAMVLQ
jgi:hypothetical protein